VVINRLVVFGSVAGYALTPGPSPKGWERGDLGRDLARVTHDEASKSSLSQLLGEGPGARACPGKRLGSCLGWIRTSRIAILLGILLCILAGARPLVAAPYDLMPRGSWIYDGMASLAARGLIPGVSARSLHGDELRTRVELARWVARLAETAGDAGGVSSEPDRALLRRLLAEFKPEYRFLRIDLPLLLGRVAATDEGQARQSQWIGTGYLMGRVRKRTEGDEVVDVIGRGTVLGLLGNHALAAGTLTNEERVWSDRPQAYSQPEKLFIRVDTKFANWQLGKEDRYWGPGYGGTMLVSDNAPSFLSLQGDKRFKLPLLGRVHFTQFVGTFVEPGGRAYVVARRLDSMVGRRFGWSLAEAYKANTARSLPLALVLPLYFYGNRILDESVRNSERLNYLGDLQLTYAAGERLNTYLDFILDDVTGFIGKSDTVPRKIGFLVGVHLPRTLGSDRTDVRLEYALTDGDDPGIPDKTEGGTYLHRNPSLAWFRDGLVMGHRMANNRRGPFVRVRHQVSPKLVGIFEWEDELQYRATPVVGDRKRMTLYGAYDFAPDKSIALRVDRLRGALGDETLWQVQAAYSF
jgi:Capsule assembly protein Wzi